MMSAACECLEHPVSNSAHDDHAGCTSLSCKGVGARDRGTNDDRTRTLGTDGHHPPPKGAKNPESAIGETVIDEIWM